jgi:hypothetical protein
VGHSYGLIYGILYYSDFIHAYFGINAVLKFVDRPALKAMHQQIQLGNTINIVRNFYAYIQDTAKITSTVLNTDISHNLNHLFLARAMQDMIEFNPQIYLDIAKKKDMQLHLYHNSNDVFILDKALLEKLKFILMLSNQFSLTLSHVSDGPHASPIYDVDMCLEWLLKCIALATL